MHAAVCYPLGFPVKLVTNSREVLRAADESWGASEKLFDAQTIELRVTVSDGAKASEPAFRVERHLLSLVSDRENCAVADLDRLTAWCHVTSGTVADAAWFRWFFLDALILSLLAQRHTAPVHAGCVAKESGGVLLFGASGAGKSTLAWACGRAGWQLVGDDAAWLLPDAAGPVAVGRPQQVRLRPDAPRHFPELAGRAVHARPNGKMSIELRTREFPSIRTASHCAVERVVFLARGEGAPALQQVTRQEALAAMLRDCVPYRDQVHARHVSVIGKLADLPAHRLRYRTLDEAIGLLERA